MKKTKAAPEEKPRLDWDDVRVFAAVAETGSFSAAARLLGVTPGMISKRIDELETRLHSQLLTRSAQGVALTKSGERVRDHAETMRHSALAIERIVSGEDKRAEGRVTISAPDGTAAYLIAPALGEFFKTHPKIQVALDGGLWPNAPLPDEPDLIITFQEDKRLETVTTPVATLHYMLMASENYLDTYGAPATFAAAADHRYVHLSAYTHQRSAWHPRAGALQQLSHANLISNSSAVHVQTILNGGGVGALPTYVMSFAKGLKVVFPEPMAKIRMYLVHHRDALDKVRVRTVAAWLRGLFDAKRQPWFREEFIHPDRFAEIERGEAR